MATDLKSAVADQLRDFEMSKIKNTAPAEFISHEGTAAGIDAEPARMTKTQADRVTVYDARGYPSDILYYMLSKKLQSGYTLTQMVKPFVGTTKCMLHPESEYRDELTVMGVGHKSCCMTWDATKGCVVHGPGCSGGKTKIPSEYELRLHMQKKHKSEWALIEHERAKFERDEQSRLMKAQTEAMLAMAKAQK
jgi:hypothetical protein